MQTKHDITVKYGWYKSTTIPAGTPVEVATNLPHEHKTRYFVEPWDGMDEEMRSWGAIYGFIVDSDQVQSA